MDSMIFMIPGKNRPCNSFRVHIPPKNKWQSFDTLPGYITSSSVQPSFHQALICLSLESAHLDLSYRFTWIRSKGIVFQETHESSWSSWKPFMASKVLETQYLRG